MTLQQLEYIIALDNYRHYVTAAEKCFVSQPNLTMQIKKLEEEIGIKIFERNKKPLRPTVKGQQILLKARQILREVNQLKEFVSTEKESLEGNFTIGIIPTLAPYLLPLFLKSFVKEHPNTHLNILELQTEEIIRRLHNGILDIGILVTPLVEKHIREVPLFQEPFLLFAPKEHQLMQFQHITPELLDPKEVLLLDKGHCFREQILAICNEEHHHSNLGFNYESGSIEALKQLVKQGVSYTLVPELSVQPLDEDYLKRFDVPQPTREVSIAVHNSFTKEALIEHLHTAILNTIPDSFKKIPQYRRVKWR